MVTSGSTKKSHRALLEIIQEKERDLTRIRQVADSAAEDELIHTQRQLQQLQSDYDRRNDTIRALQQHIYDLEEEHTLTVQNIERKGREAVKEGVAEIIAKSEEELRKRVKDEFNERLSSKEEILENRFQKAIVDELQNQEMRMNDEFNRLMRNREVEHEKEIAKLQYEIEAGDSKMADLSRKKENEVEACVAQCKREMNDEFDDKIKSELGICQQKFRTSISMLEEDKDCLKTKLHQSKQDISKVEAENEKLTYRVEELLSFLHNMESEYMNSICSMESRERTMEAQIHELQSNTKKLEASLTKGKEEYEENLSRIQNQRKSEKKALERTIKKLKQEFEVVKDEKEECEELVKEKENESHNTKHHWKEKVSILKRECKSLRQEIGSMHTKIVSARRNDSTKQEEIELAILNKETDEDIARQRLLHQYEDALKREKKVFTEEKVRLVRELGEMKKAKEAANLGFERARADCEALRMELSSLQQRHSEEIEASIKKNHELNIVNDKFKGENHHLKDSIKSMRSEMERLIASSSESQQQHNSQSNSTVNNFSNSSLQPIHSGVTQASLHKERFDSHRKESNSHQSKTKIERIDIALQNLTDQNKLISKERDNLIDISNQLRAKMLQMQNDYDSKQSKKKQDFISEQNQIVGDINVQDLAKDIWAKAVNPVELRQSTKVKTSQRATKSQQYLHQRRKINIDKKADFETVNNRTNRSKIRNWNNKEDE